MDIKKLYYFLAHDIWRINSADLEKPDRLKYNLMKTAVLIVRGFQDNDINTRANSLTYSMMFAIVPLIALMVSFARGFGFESVIEEKLMNSFVGSTGIVPTIMGFVQRYLETATGGAFLGIGILVLLWSVYSFFQNIETSFNKIWQVKSSRSYVRQFTNYLTILIMIPVLMIVSSGMSLLFSGVESSVQALQEIGAIKEFFIRLIPWMMIWLLFFFMYKLIPNTRVHWLAAAIPAFFIGTLVQALQSLSVSIIGFLGRTSIVYGTFAAIPILLMWLQWTCMLIYIGATMSYAIQNNERFDFATDMELMSRRYKDFLTLYVCYQIIKRFEAGEAPFSAHDLAEANHMPVRLINRLLGRMTEVGILNEIFTEDEHSQRTYQPAMDIHQITVGMLFERIDKQGSERFLRNTTSEMNDFWSRWVSIKKEEKEFLSVRVMDL